MLFRKAYFLLKSLKNQYLPRDNLIKLQNRKLRYLVNYVYKNNIFYHELYKKHNVDISKIKTINDIKRLPLITKQDLQQSYMKIKNLDHGLISDDSVIKKYPQNLSIKGGVVRRTGGSTGLPLYVFFDNYAWDYAEAIYARSLFGAGYNIFDTLVVSNPFKEPKKKWFNYLGLFKKSHLSMDLDIEKQINILKTQKSHFMFYSYPTLLMLLAKRLDKPPSNLKGIISTGERLTDESREFIESKFKCPVYNHYGTMELNRIAWECTRKEGLHMDIDAHLIEFVKGNEDVSNGELGEIIITNLNNYSFPLIRYRQGDFGIPIDDSCSCGRTLPLVKTIIGRENDFIKLSTGEYISPIPIDLALTKINGISQFQLIQKKINDFEIKLVCNPNCDTKMIQDEIENMIKQILNNKNIYIKFNFVDSIRRSPGGKLRTIISYIS